VRIAQISDTHLTYRGGPTEANFKRLVAHFNEDARPDVVVITGDVQVINPDDAGDRAHSRALADLLEVPVRVVPGNHDVGEPGEHPWAGLGVSEERVAAFEATWGPSYWRHDLPGATLIGVNSELLSSGLAREAAQWAWLEQTVDELTADTPVLVFMHKPLWHVDVDVPVQHQVNLDAASRDRLLALFERAALRVVGSGHLHVYRHRRRGEVVEVWAPSTAFAVRDDHEILGGIGEIGYVEYVVEGGAVEANFRSIPGLIRTTNTRIPQVNEARAEALGGLVAATSA
jgi:3',5'-cyclic AMP phosphodiesterase CpdA